MPFASSQKEEEDLPKERGEEERLRKEEEERLQKEEAFIVQHLAPVREQTFKMLERKEGKAALKREARPPP